MHIHVRLFAGARDALGAGSLSLTLPDGAVAGDVLALLVEDRPSFARLAGVSKLAINGEYVEPSAPIVSGDEVAILPPVSGGA